MKELDEAFVKALFARLYQRYDGRRVILRILKAAEAVALSLVEEARADVAAATAPADDTALFVE